MIYRRLLSARVFFLCLAAAILFSWPMLLVSAPLVFPDTGNHITQGAEFLNSLVTMVTGGGAESLRVDGETAASRTMRSAPYSVFIYVTSHAPSSPIVPTILQAMAIFLMLFDVMPREIHAPRAAIWGAVLVLAALTPLPWFTSYLMPDILAAGILLYGAWLVGGIADFTRLEKGVLAALASGCVLSHYGNIPVAALVLASALVLLAWRRQLRVEHVVLAAVPVVAALGFNAMSGAIFYDGASAAPRRLPILLARSITDGPARLYLEEHCGIEAYRICEVFKDGVPDNVHDVLWDEEGGLRTLERQDLEEIRDEESTILLRAFLDYPLAQSKSFLANGVRQFAMIGTDEFWPAEISVNPWGTPRLDFDRDGGREDNRLERVIDGFGVVHAASFWAGLVVLLWIGWRDGWRGRERDVLVVVAVGLVTNAVIFGGLSAPAERYQARIAWIVPVLAALFALARFRQRNAGIPRPEPSG